mgnify:CR=1 FL=1
MDLAQIVLLLVIVVLAILLAVLGIQVFLILREIRKTVEKTNKVLDNAGIIAESLSTPISTLSSLAMSIKTGISFANWLKKTFSKGPSEERSEGVMAPERRAKELNGEAQASAPASKQRKPMIRRFFRGIGKKIKI